MRLMRGIRVARRVLTSSVARAYVGATGSVREVASKYCTNWSSRDVDVTVFLFSPAKIGLVGLI